MRLRLVDENATEVREPYEARLPGWTEQRYFDEAPEVAFYELKDGELIVHSPVNTEHQEAVRFLTVLLTVTTSRRDLGTVYNGPAVLRVRQGLAREPDIFFVAASQSGNVAAEYVSAPVDLVIEVLSESGRTRDLQEKPREYESAGVKEYWVVDLTSNEIVVHRLGLRGYEVHTMREGRLESTAVPGFWVDVAWLWQSPLPGEYDCLRELMAE